MKLALVLVSFLQLVFCSLKRRMPDYREERDHPPEKRPCHRGGPMDTEIPRVPQPLVILNDPESLPTTYSLFQSWLSTSPQSVHFATRTQELVIHCNTSATNMIQYLPLIYSRLERTEIGFGWTTLFGQRLPFNFSIPPRDYHDIDLIELFNSLAEHQLNDVAKMLILLQHSFLFTTAGFSENPVSSAKILDYLNTVVPVAHRSSNISLKRAAAFVLGFYLRYTEVMGQIGHVRDYKGLGNGRFVEIFNGFRFRINTHSQFARDQSKNMISQALFS